MNQKVIEEAIAQRMKTQSGESASARATAYMEKLCQNAWRLPTIRRADQALVEFLKETVDEDTRTWIRQGIGPLENQCLPPNPRRLKGLANLIGRLSSRLISHESDQANIVETQLLLIVAYIYQFHHSLYVRWQADLSLYKKIYEWCARPDGELPFDARLELPLQSPASDSTEPTPEELQSAYPDPTEANVFWIQPLIVNLGKEIDPSQFECYLHGSPT